VIAADSVPGYFPSQGGQGRKLSSPRGRCTGGCSSGLDNNKDLANISDPALGSASPNGEGSVERYGQIDSSPLLFSQTDSSKTPNEPSTSFFFCKEAKRRLGVAEGGLPLRPPCHFRVNTINAVNTVFCLVD